MKKHKVLTSTTYRKLISYLSISLLIANISLANATVLGSEKMLLCTSQGYTWISLNQLDSEKNKNTYGTAHVHKCPLCAFTPEDNAAIIQYFYGPKPYNTKPIDKITGDLHLLTSLVNYSPLQSRAPPISYL